MAMRKAAGVKGSGGGAFGASDRTLTSSGGGTLAGSGATLGTGGRQFKRRIIQLLAALLMNLNLAGFSSGSIYKGASKMVCAPGLNCYSCPGAVLACPIGSLSASLQDLNYKLPFYMIGTILAFGAFFGRTICGWLCPFGFIQELLDKIPLPKLPKSRVTRRLSLLKYLVLVGLVIAVPLFYRVFTGVAYPAFCAWLCPAGTLQAGIPLIIANPPLRALLGWLFSWKILFLALTLVACLFIYRPFCRWLCPLGALLSFFNRFSLLGYRVDKNRCTACGNCVASCKMDVHRVSDRECIQCGRCRMTCTAGVINFSIRLNAHSQVEPPDSVLPGRRKGNGNGLNNS